MCQLKGPGNSPILLFLNTDLPLEHCSMLTEQCCYLHCSCSGQTKSFAPYSNRFQINLRLSKDWVKFRVSLWLNQTSSLGLSERALMHTHCTTHEPSYLRCPWLALLTIHRGRTMALFSDLVLFSPSGPEPHRYLDKRWWVKILAPLLLTVKLPLTSVRLGFLSPYSGNFSIDVRRCLLGEVLILV